MSRRQGTFIEKILTYLLAEPLGGVEVKSDLGWAKQGQLDCILRELR